MRDESSAEVAAGEPVAASGADRLTAEEREDLRAVARLSLEHGVRHGEAPAIDLLALPPALHALRASFVTLERHGTLRGCIGTLEPVEPLAVSVARNAVKAAKDPRLPAVTADELPELSVKISVLSRLEPLAAASPAELRAALEPGRHGLVIREGQRSATFLPAVWASLPEPEAFLRELWRKAWLPDGHWSPRLECWLYTVEEVR